MKPNSNRFAMALLCAACVAACSDDKDNDKQSGNEGNTPVIVENTSDLCSDNLDNDNNGLKDCADPGCKDFAFCHAGDADKENTLAACMDKVDNDGDGKTDCDDEECQDFAICQDSMAENTLAACQDGKDNDKDGLIDCQDPECQSFNVCGGSSEPVLNGEESTVTACYFDGIDNDGDTLIDCDDPNCKIYAFCQNLDLLREDTLAACQDGIDNDEDGLADCLDPDCSPFLACYDKSARENTEELCSDGKDNDEDDQVDCLDPDCWQFAICSHVVGIVENTRELCSDGKDNDFNGKADAEDPSCARFYNGGGKTGENTAALCKDGTDNDGDDLKDCDDPECQIYDFCDKSYSEAGDECKDDPYKFKKDTCNCGETLVDGACYTNIASADAFITRLANSSGKFILKADIDFGATTQAPIAGFAGTLDGGNKRITGVFDQKSDKATYESLSGYACGLFHQVKGATIKNLDIAITLNCDNRDHSNDYLWAGAIASTIVKTTASHITGSSKVYVEEKSTSSSTAQDGITKYIGGLFGRVESSEIDDVRLFGNVSADLPNNPNFKSGETYHILVGGLTGNIRALSDSDKQSEIRNVDADVYVTLKTGHKAAKYNETIGGIVGSSNGPIENVTSRGAIKLVSDVNNIAGSTEGGTHVGGIVGKMLKNSIRNVSFSGLIQVPNKRSYAMDFDTKLGVNIGGCAGIVSAPGIGIDNCRVDAEIQATAANTSIGGIAGRLFYLNKSYIRNSTSNIDLVLSNKGTQSDLRLYYGGIVGRSNGEPNSFENVNYIINNSARTNHFLSADNNIDILGTINIGGIAGFGGYVVNNFASDKMICDGPCHYTVLGVNGAYAYESYWNGDVAAVSGGTYIDATVEPYTYNVENIPVNRSGRSILGMLRYNAGYDGGVLSAHIPAPDNTFKYNDWTTITDEDGHVIPVPTVE